MLRVSRSNPTSDADRNLKGQLVRQRHGQAYPVERGVFQVVGRHRDLHGFTFPLEAPPRDMLLSVGPRSWFVTRSPVPGSKPKGVLSAAELHEADQQPRVVSRGCVLASPN